MSGFESLPSLPVPAHFREPFSDTRWNKPYGASPARPYGDSVTEERQESMNAEFNKLFEFPPAELEIPDSFRRSLIESERYARIRRNLVNHYHYEAWRKTNPEIPQSLEREVNFYEKGQASILEIGRIATQTSLQAFMMGKLTHPYWQRIEELPKMREDTAEVIESLGGVVFPFSGYRSIKIIPQTSYNPESSTEELTFIGVEYLRDFGQIPLEDGDKVNSIERQVASYRVDEVSGFPSDIIEKMNNPHLFIDEDDARDFSWTNLQDPRHKIFMDLSGCEEFIVDSVQSNSVEPYVVPVETSEFGYKGENIHTTNK